MAERDDRKPPARRAAAEAHQPILPGLGNVLGDGTGCVDGADGSATPSGEQGDHNGRGGAAAGATEAARRRTGGPGDPEADPFFEELGPRFRAFVDRLDRPLVFLDTETTGTDPQRDRIVELSLVEVRPKARRIGAPKTYRINPEIPIPAEATAVHGISDEDVAGCPTFAQVAAEIAAALDGADIGGFNVLRFDLRLLEAEFARAGMAVDLRNRRIIDAQVIFHVREPRTLEAAVRFYRGKELVGAHGAEADTLASLEVLAGQLARYNDLEPDPQTLYALSVRREQAYVDTGRRFVWRDGEPAFNFGKHKGTPLRVLVESSEGRGYLRWMLEGSFDEDTKRVIRQAMDGKIPRRPKDMGAGA